MQKTEKPYVKVPKNNWNVKNYDSIFKNRVSVIYYSREAKRREAKCGKKSCLVIWTDRRRTFGFPCCKKASLLWKLRIVNNFFLDFSFFVWYYIRVKIGWTRLTACLSAERLCFSRGNSRKTTGLFRRFSFYSRDFGRFVNKYSAFLHCFRWSSCVKSE